ncbi:MAG: putative high light inducible protein [Cyanobacteriota bacterium]
MSSPTPDASPTPAASPSPASEPVPPATSATTRETPAFGWSAYAERVNGRFAMLGFVAVLLIEGLSRDTFLHWAGLVP